MQFNGKLYIYFTHVKTLKYIKNILKYTMRYNYIIIFNMSKK